MWKSKIINLLSEEKAMAAFTPSEITLKGIEIEERATKDDNLKAVLSFV